MEIEYTKNFLKHYKVRIATNKSLNTKFSKRLALFQDNSRSPMLKDHKLRGQKGNQRAFSVSGDIGTHNQVY